MSSKIKCRQRCRLNYFCFSLFLTLLCFSSAALADLSGRLQFSYENYLSDNDSTSQVFTQDYAATLRGVMLDQEIGSYQLGLQYQKGSSELANLTWSDTLNFHDTLQVTSTYLRKSTSTRPDDQLIENRLALATVLSTTTPFSLNAAYEDGNTTTPFGAGEEKRDKKASLGLTYNQDRQHLDLKYSRSVLFDDTFLAEATNLAVRENALQVNGGGGWGDLFLYNGTYSGQTIANQVGSTSRYDQQLRNLDMSGDFRLLGSWLSLKPHYSQRDNLIDYALPTVEVSEQRTEMSDLGVSLRPFQELELIAAAGAGPNEIIDANGRRRQNVSFNQAGFNARLGQYLSANANYKKELYADESANGSATRLDGYLTGQLRPLKLSLKKNYTSYGGVIYTFSDTNYRRQDITALDFEIKLSDNLTFLGGQSSAALDVNWYTSTKFGGKYRYGNNSLELSRENKYGDEVAQIIYYQTDALTMSLYNDPLVFQQRLSFLTNSARSTETPNAPTVKQTGFASYSEVKWGVGDSVLTASFNMERQVQSAPIYKKLYCSFTRYY